MKMENIKGDTETLEPIHMRRIECIFCLLSYGEGRQIKKNNSSPTSHLLYFKDVLVVGYMGTSNH